MPFVSSAHRVGVLFLLLLVVSCGVRRLHGISVLPELANARVPPASLKAFGLNAL